MNIIIGIIKMKICIVCKIEKENDMFSEKRDKCKTCRNKEKKKSKKEKAEIKTERKFELTPERLKKRLEFIKGLKEESRKLGKDDSFISKVFIKAEDRGNHIIHEIPADLKKTHIEYQQSDFDKGYLLDVVLVQSPTGYAIRYII
jgi:hypothetical protein